MRVTIASFVSALVSVAYAQDQCNLLPVAIQGLPLQALEGNGTLCKTYTPAGQTQYEFISNLVNLAFTGKFKPLPNLWPAVVNGTYQSSGILDPNAIYRDPCYTVEHINLVPYFNGTWKSNNRGGKAVSINFLDGGGVTALESGVPAWDKNSKQYKLFTSLYAYFGVILGCEDPSFPKYKGSASQAHVHRFMDLKAPEMHYFIHNIYDAALTLGVAGPNLITHVGDAISIGVGLDNVFNKKCSPSQKIATYQHAGLQSICSNNATCAPWAFPNTTCASYNIPAYGVMPALADPVSPSASLCNPHYQPTHSADDY